MTSVLEAPVEVEQVTPEDEAHTVCPFCYVLDEVQFGMEITALCGYKEIFSHWMPETTPDCDECLRLCSMGCPVCGRKVL